MKLFGLTIVPSSELDNEMTDINMEMNLLRISQEKNLNKILELEKNKVSAENEKKLLRLELDELRRTTKSNYNRVYELDEENARLKDLVKSYEKKCEESADENVRLNEDNTELIKELAEALEKIEELTAKKTRTRKNKKEE